MSYGLAAGEWYDGPGAGGVMIPETGDDSGEPDGYAPPAATGGVSVGPAGWVSADGATLSPAGLTVLPTWAPRQVRRSVAIPTLFAVPLMVSAVGYFGGGLQVMTDVAFLLLVGLCGTLLGVELVQFGRRMGVGAILIYGGVLVWFCHDYAVNWFANDYLHRNPFFPYVKAETVSRAMFYHCVFIEMMVVGLGLPWERVPVLRDLPRAVTLAPEPADRRFYLGLVLGMLGFGWTAYIFTNDLWPVSIVKAAFWWVPGVGQVSFNVYRNNLATTWGAYVAQILQVGQVGGVLGAFYALLIARSAGGRAVGWGAWAFWLSSVLPGERRGDVAFMALPVMGVVFLKYHAMWDPARRAIARRWLVRGLVGVVLLWVGVQVQSASRMGGGVQLTRAAGNTMFSEGLNTWDLIPDRHGFAYDTWPGEGIIKPIPDTVWWLVTGPIPRMIWTGKPVEDFQNWYSSFISKDPRMLQSGGMLGTTVSNGAVGYWYFRYGPAGVVEGGLIYGLMMSVAERALRRAQGRPLKVMFALAFAGFIFRSYRDLWWQNLYPVLIGQVVLWGLIRFGFGARNDRHLPLPVGGSPPGGGRLTAG